MKSPWFPVYTGTMENINDADIQNACSSSWASLDGIKSIDERAFEGFTSAYEAHLVNVVGGPRPCDDVDPSVRYFAVGTRVIIFFDAEEDTGAAVLVFDRMTGVWLDAGEVWARL